MHVGLSMSTEVNNGGLYDGTPDITFQNTGSNAAYGPTREPAWYAPDCRTADSTLNALHHILRDRPCLESFQALVAGSSISAFDAHETTAHSAPFCESWHAPPCSSTVFALLAFVSQFTHLADSWLSLFSLDTSMLDDLTVPGSLLGDHTVPVEIREFSAGSYTSILLLRLLNIFSLKLRITVNCIVGALALPASQLSWGTSGLRIIHVIEDKACRWEPSDDTLAELRARGIDVTILYAGNMYGPWSKVVLRKSQHGSSFLVRGHESLCRTTEVLHLQNALAQVVMSAVGNNARYFWLYLSWFSLSGNLLATNLLQILHDPADSRVPSSLRETFFQVCFKHFSLSYPFYLICGLAMGCFW